MLANTLSVEDEEAVQAELRELEAEAVCEPTLQAFLPYTDFIRTQLGVPVAQKPVVLPSVPVDKPVSEPPTEVVEEETGERQRVPIPA